MTILDETYTLSNGVLIPKLGFGTWFIDDDRAKEGTRIHGVPVLGDLERLEEVLAAQQIEEVVIASGKIVAARVRRLQATCATRGVGVVRAGVRFE